MLTGTAREALAEVRAAKKPVLTYAVGYVDDGLLLAAQPELATCLYWWYGGC